MSHIITFMLRYAGNHKYMSKEQYSNLNEHVKFVMKAHEGDVRGWDMETPYAIHPLWCSMTIYSETTLPKQIRDEGAVVLLYHDILEDTKLNLPDNLTPDEVDGIIQMTFTGMTQEMVEVWNREPKIRLFKLYDKISNLLDSSWMTPEIIEIYTSYTKKLLEDVEQNFGQLNITRIARAILYKKF
ncbi:hypothetical protein GW797_00075 [Candidatus Parcubacteria bacterium]|nr:hypothetical protein [Candidatus Parcubacteria bacterium]